MLRAFHSLIFWASYNRSVRGSYCAPVFWFRKQSQRAQATCSRSHSKSGTVLGFECASARLQSAPVTRCMELIFRSSFPPLSQAMERLSSLPAPPSGSTTSHFPKMPSLTAQTQVRSSIHHSCSFLSACGTVLLIAVAPSRKAPQEHRLFLCLPIIAFPVLGML